MRFCYPNVRAAPGFAGFRPWVRKGIYRPVGRREILVAEVSRLWHLGLSVRQIADALGPVKGVKFNYLSISFVISRERQYGDPKLFPLRRSADDGEPDNGISERMAMSLGL